jgi:hypothetical protein
MRIGLIDVDSHNFPNLALMKISAYHKAQGDEVEWWWGWGQYDRVYMSKVFDNTYSPDHPEPVNAKEIIKGGTGYGLDNKLPDEIEHMYPDYSLYPELTKEKSFGFLTRGCPNNCPFCIVCAKEGRKSYKVADLSEWWNGQKNIVLNDPNILACRDHMDLLDQLAQSKAWVEFNQGIDARMLTEANIEALNRVKVSTIHFAWDLMDREEQVRKGLELYRRFGKIKNRARLMCYVLVNYNSSIEEDLYRCYTLRDLGFDPFVMVFDKPNAPRDIRRLQRWCNNKYVFGSCKRFEDYKG